MYPVQIKLELDELTGEERLSLRWSDGHAGRIGLRTLRDSCPCASCKGETVLLKSYKPVPEPELPGKYKLVNAQQVGSYAVALTWGDGHSTGIYTWETLRNLCECEACVRMRQGASAPSKTI